MRLAGRAGLLAVIGLLAAGIGVATYLAGVLGGLELDSVDARYAVRGDLEGEDRVALVLIDDESFNELNEQWPFPRSMHGRVIDELERAGASVIAYDVQFTEPTDASEDNALIRAVDRADPVILATTEVDGRGRSKVLGGERRLRQIGARAANTTFEADADGVWRRVPYSQDGMISFAAAAAEAASGEPVDPDAIPDDGAWIDYRGPTGKLPAIPFWRILRGQYEPDALAGKVVVIGASAPSLQDVHPVPLGAGDVMSGAEINANAIATLLDGAPLRSLGTGLSLLLIVAFGFLAPLASLRLSPLRSLALAGLVAVGFLLIAQASFERDLVLPVVHPLLALIAGAVGALAMQYALTAFERQRVRDTFARFVPNEVVEQLMADVAGGGELHLGGVRKDCTVLFSDIRGFTSYAEQLPPDQVVAVLNRYLGAMTDAIMDHGGTLISYMGDGIMAVFGAPLDQPDHADRAVAAAREMLDVRLADFNAWMREAEHGEGFRMGVGLNSGTVMSGQVGSLRRMEYTTIGDTVNTSARLEGMTKGTPHQLFISESTRQALLREPEALLLVGDLEVRGRAATIRVWSLPEPGAEAQPHAGEAPGAISSAGS